MTKSHLKGWYLQGKYFGYPRCCIEAFLREEQCHDSVFYGTGFLPCKKCNKRDPFEIVEIINTNRVCPEKFELVVVPVVFNSPEWDYGVVLADKLWKASEDIGL